MPFLASLVLQWPSKIKKEYARSSILLPQSHEDSIFRPEVADSRNVLVALSLGQLFWLQLFLLYPNPQVLGCEMMNSSIPLNERGILLFFRWKVCSDSVWRMYGVIFLPNGECSKSRQSLELRGSYVASFPAYFNIILLPPVACCQLSCIALSRKKVPGWSGLKGLGEMHSVESS